MSKRVRGHSPLNLDVFKCTARGKSINHDVGDVMSGITPTHQSMHWIEVAGHDYYYYYFFKANENVVKVDEPAMTPSIAWSWYIHNDADAAVNPLGKALKSV